MDFSNGEIHIFSASLDFSIGEIQSGAKPTDFSIGEIHHFMGQLPAGWGSACPWGLGDGAWGYGVTPHPMGQPTVWGNPPPWGVGDGLGVWGPSRGQNGGAVARLAGAGPWLGRRQRWARELGGGEPPIQWDNPLYGATPHHGGWGMGFGFGAQLVARTAGGVAGLAGAGGVNGGAVAVIAVTGTAGVVARMVEPTGSVTTHCPVPSPTAVTIPAWPPPRRLSHCPAIPATAPALLVPAPHAPA